MRSDQAEFVVRQRLLGMQVCILNQLKYLPRLVVRMEVDPEFVVDVSESPDPAVFTGGYDPARFSQFRLSPAHVLGVVKLVVAPVLERTIGVYAGFMGEGVRAHTRLVDRDRQAKGV